MFYKKRSQENKYGIKPLDLNKLTIDHLQIDISPNKISSTNRSNNKFMSTFDR